MSSVCSRDVGHLALSEILGVTDTVGADCCASCASDSKILVLGEAYCNWSENSV